MEKSERFFSFEDAKAKIENWCAYRDRSENETVQKLLTFDLNEKEIARTIQHLKVQNFIDDKRFAESYVTGKFRIKNWGKKKIYAHLLQKHIDKSHISEALMAIDYDEYLQVAQKIIEKKWNALIRESDDWKRKQKVIQYAASRGFEFGVIQEAFDNFLNPS